MASFEQAELASNAPLFTAPPLHAGLLRAVLSHSHRLLRLGHY